MNDTEQATLCGLAAAYIKLQLQFEPRDQGSKAAYVKLQLQFESRERGSKAAYVKLQLFAICHKLQQSKFSIVQLPCPSLVLRSARLVDPLISWTHQIRHLLERRLFFSLEIKSRDQQTHLVGLVPLRILAATPAE